MPDAHDRGEANVVGALALALADRLNEAAQSASGLAGAAPAALVSLHEFAGGRPIEVLAGALRVSHSRAVRVVDQLEAAGLVERRRAPHDGRAVLVTLTARGRRDARRVLAARGELLETVLGELSGAQREALAGLAGKALENIVGGRRDARAICRLCDAHACGHAEGRCPVTQAADAAEQHA